MLGAQDLYKKLIWTKIQLIPKKNYYGLGTQRNECYKKAYLRRFYVKEPRHTEKQSILNVLPLR